MLRNLIRLARPLDWIKNVFVVLPLPFAVAAGTAAAFSLSSFLLGFFGFCLISSAVYVFNDLCDAAADRLHPKKRFRPLASGAVSPTVAMVLSLILLILGLGLCAVADRSYTITIAAIYVLTNLAYSVGAKKVPLLDVFILASGFVLRVWFGCALLSVFPSSWLLLCTATLALFLGFIKRRADLIEELDFNHRPSLRGYSKSFLDQAVGICAGVAILAYALYCVEVRGVLKPGREMASLPFVAYGIFDYLRLAYVKGYGDSPVEIAYKSLSLQVCGLGWIAAVSWSLGLW